MAIKNINEETKPKKEEKNNSKEKEKKITYPKTSEIVKNIEKIEKEKKYGKTINNIARITDFYLTTSLKSANKVAIEHNIKELKEMQNKINDFVIYSYSKKEENREKNILSELLKKQNKNKEKKEVKK